MFHTRKHDTTRSTIKLNALTLCAPLCPSVCLSARPKTQKKDEKANRWFGQASSRPTQLWEGGAWQPCSDRFDEQGVVNEEVTTNYKT